MCAQTRELHRCVRSWCAPLPRTRLGGGTDQASALLTLGDTYEKSSKACLAHSPRSCAGGDRKELRHDQEWANHHPGHERPDGGCYPDHGQHLHRADRASHGERENRHDLDRRSRQDPVLLHP